MRRVGVFFSHSLSVVCFCVQFRFLAHVRRDLFRLFSREIKKKKRRKKFIYSLFFSVPRLKSRVQNSAVRSWVGCRRKLISG